MHNIKDNYKEMNLDNLNILHIEESDNLSIVPQLYHGLENIVFNKGILTMKDVYKLR